MSKTQTTNSTEIKNTVTRPGRYKVVIFNDDKTSMEFVISLLSQLFDKTDAEAYKLTMQIHETGHAVAGIYNREIAEQKVYESINVARSYGYPLELLAEKE